MKKAPNQSLKDSTKNLILFIVFPLSQLVIYSLTSLEVTSSFSLSFPILLFLLLLGAFSCFLALYLWRKHIRQNRFRSSFRSLTSLRELEAEHYRQIAQRREALEHLKEEFSKELTDILTCLTQDDAANAKEQMENLSERLAATKEYPYCSHPIVNAVLSEKENDCRADGISLQINLMPCRFSLITNLHLCSLLSNLLDNAIQACRQFPDPQRRIILLSVGEFGDYLTIKVVNPVSPHAVSRPREGHGFGQRILKDIARQYHGEFTARSHNGQYTATVTLLLPEAA